MAPLPKVTTKQLTPVEKSRIWTLYEEGYNPTQIHHKTKIPRTTISGFITRHASAPNNTFESKPRSGRRKKSTPRGTRALLKTATTDTRTTLKALGTPSKSGKRLCTKTIAKVLKFTRKAKHRPRKNPFLTPLHKKKRREHCKAEKAMGRNNRKVCWSDEVTFELGEDLTTFWITRGSGREE
jgi:hypothetical protein